jgi:cytochrome oxidase assembly protein ShyY1
VQWFALALALIIIYIVVNLKENKSEFKDGK